jgi:hypothetical protein
MRKPYPTDLSDDEWNYIEPHMPAAKEHGRPRIHSPREILNTIFYVLRAAASGAYSLTPSSSISKIRASPARIRSARRTCLGMVTCPLLVTLASCFMASSAISRWAAACVPFARSRS